MDFFRYQEQARRRTLLLLGYFFLAVAGIVFTVYLAFLFLISGNMADGLWQPDLLLPVAVAVIMVIIGGTLWKTCQLSTGGPAVAEMLGGRRIFPGSTDLQEKKLLNVVEEMAIASGTPMPAVYLLPEESGINAFAAGFRGSDAAIAVTVVACKT